MSTETDHDHNYESENPSLAGVFRAHLLKDLRFRSLGVVVLVSAWLETLPSDSPLTVSDVNPQSDSLTLQSGGASIHLRHVPRAFAEALLEFVESRTRASTI